MDDEDLFEEEDVFDARPLWLQLPVRLLNERGKRVVSADPDLRKETMEALMRVHPLKPAEPSKVPEMDPNVGKAMKLLETNPQLAQLLLAATQMQTMNI